MYGYPAERRQLSGEILDLEFLNTLFSGNIASIGKLAGEDDITHQKRLRAVMPDQNVRMVEILKRAPPSCAEELKCRLRQAILVHHNDLLPAAKPPNKAIQNEDEKFKELIGFYGPEVAITALDSLQLPQIHQPIRPPDIFRHYLLTPKWKSIPLQPLAPQQLQQKQSGQQKGKGKDKKQNRPTTRERPARRSGRISKATSSSSKAAKGKRGEKLQEVVAEALETASGVDADGDETMTECDSDVE
ncbi:hypothetical protein TWF730_003788 [Orbilia blumenaviensis]|uniref:Uncharacterized protein n=1 Tax=Orbilia blumenaviensis TaxID=1796055 RepID=A0AAV9U6B8_9PEZI